MKGHLGSQDMRRNVLREPVLVICMHSVLSSQEWKMMALNEGDDNKKKRKQKSTTLPPQHYSQKGGQHKLSTRLSAIVPQYRIPHPSLPITEADDRAKHDGLNRTVDARADGNSRRYTRAHAHTARRLDTQ